MEPEKQLYTLAQVTEALTLRGSLQGQIDDLKHQVEALSLQVKLWAHPGGSIATGSKIFVSRKDAAAILSISVSTLEQLIAQGEIKIRCLGKRVMIPREQLERLANRDIRIIWPNKRQGKTVRK
jgi:excisionase family DNA binding protein